MWDLFGKPTKPIFTWSALYTSKIGDLGKGKSLYFCLIITAFTKSYDLGCHVLEKNNNAKNHFLHQTVAVAQYLDILHDFVAIQNALVD